MTINKSISINATSQTAEGQPIAYFSASVSVSGSGTSSNMTIDNQDLYEANKLQVRKDKADFDNAVYKVEDAQASTATTEG